MDTTDTSPDPIHRNLGLWDAVSIVVGIIIGVGIFETPHDIFARVPHPAYAIGLWVLGGVLAFIGALCFAELASAYPRSGGEYVYLTRAFGPLTGFLFAWSQLSVTRSGSIASMAYIFGLHTATLFGRGDNSTIVFLLAGVSVFGLTVINILGVRMGTRTQNVLTAAKVLGLAALIVVGFVWADPDATVTHHVPAPTQGVWFASAMIFVLWTYSGWHEAAYIVAEAKNHTRNIPLALMIGTLIVTVIYIMVNLALLYGLDFSGAQDKNATENLLNLVWPTHGAHIMSILIMISALGAINGMIFTTARIYSEFGKDHRVFRTMSHWSKTFHTPVRALVIQGVICLAIIAGVGLTSGGDPFYKTVKLTAAVFWAFFCLTGVSLIMLRERDGQTARPFRVPGYPVLPIIFASWCAYMVTGTIVEDYQNKSLESLIGVGILLIGLPLYFLPQKLRAKKPEQDLQPLSK